MASSSISQFGLQLLVVISLFHHLSNIAAASARKLIIISSNSSNSNSSSSDQSSSSNHYLHYHNGTLLTGRITIHLLWYGNFKPSQRAIISDFIASLSSSPENNLQKHPSVSTWWWKAIHNYYDFAGAPSSPGRLSLELGKQILDHNYTFGKSLSKNQIAQLAAAAANKDDNNGRNAVNVVLTADDVAVDNGFCRSKCGTHGYSNENNTNYKGKKKNYYKKSAAYIWVGNSESQCPGYCAWPFHQPPQKLKQKQNQSLITSPNNDMGMDGMVANFAGLLAATVTNPFGNGYYYYKGGEGEGDYDDDDDDDGPLEAASACTGVYAKNAYLDLLVDPIVGASYNANGANGRRYLVPAIYNPITSTCSSTHI
ncbi:protein PHOSPHATE-INDUCED 1-like [Impatiens glandulifera]|uniref:protein PHOSPHATE-INDUCED 1-like n=1 Tax=Impatiens glandulifera TaxID=253017 RepID=UPI001FB073B9|nr:protein PHOSPHATE-INDUCED 1-like [Impatiens glandulifera]